MPTPLYFAAKEKLKNVMVELTDEQGDQRARDRELIKAINDYYAPYQERWRDNGRLFNLIQAGSNDVTSNWYLGWARLLINHSMALLTAGNPKGDFEPIGNSDMKMKILVNSLVEHIVNKCGWSSHQRLWIQDLHIFGNGVTKSYSELPMRRKKYERNGKMVDKVVRDFRKSKVGIRRKSPFRCMRSHFISDPDDVPFSFEYEDMTWNGFVTKYCDAILPDGTKKYDTDQIPVGSHARILNIYDEQENVLRTYCITYGGKPESTYERAPNIDELGYPIYDNPLSRYKLINQGKTVIGGANIPGLSPLAFATFDDQLDDDFETYSICGMGIPQIIEGPEAVMQGLVNMSIDNERLRSTIPISYEPNSPDSPTALDLDVSTMYSGLVIDGKITPQPLGIGSAGSNQILWEWLKFLIYQLTGVNPEPLTGDNLKTAYQSGLLIRQMNLRAQARIRAWENGPLKRAWTVLMANALSDVTTEEWEEITEDDAKRAQEMIKMDKMTAEDYREMKDGKETIYEKRSHTYIPVKGYKFREDFTGKNKKRTLDGSVESTLIEDSSLMGSTSYVTADQKYLFPSGSIESIMEFQVRVDGSGMLTDLKAQDMDMAKNAILNAQSIAQFDPQFTQDIDWKKLYIASIEPTGITEDQVFKQKQPESDIQKAFKQITKELEEETLSPQSNVLPQPVPQQTNSVGSQGIEGERGRASRLVGDLAGGGGGGM
jgi:hypothetical protein